MAATQPISTSGVWPVSTWPALEWPWLSLHQPAVPEATMGKEVPGFGTESSSAMDPLLLPTWSEMRADGPKAGSTLAGGDLRAGGGSL